MAIDAGPWRDGGYLVATRGSTMPRRCMICGADVEVLRETAVLLPRNVRPKDGIGGIATGVHALLAGERFRVRHGRCRRHRVNWIRYLGLLAGLACVASMVGFAGSIMSRNGRFGLVDAILLVAFILSIAATIWAGYLDLRISKLDGRHAWIGGFGEGYLAMLPEFPGRGRAKGSWREDSSVAR